jgi:hypothetical protein
MCALSIYYQLIFVSMSQQRKSKNIWFIGGATLVALLGVFVASRIIPIIRGSEITLAIPHDSEVSQPIISLSGSAHDTKKLTVNGSPVLLSPTGTFQRTILLHPGYNTITLDSVDNIGHTKKRTYAFLLKELETGTFALSSLPNQN